MECPACGGSLITMEVGPDLPPTTSIVNALLAAGEDEVFVVTRNCWDCGWCEDRSVSIDSIETTEGDAQAVEHAKLIDNIVSETTAINSLTTLEDVLAEVHQRRRLESADEDIEVETVSDSDSVYQIRDRTGNPEHASLEEVCDQLLSRAAEQRRGHPDANLDDAMAIAIDRYGETTVREISRRILVDQVPFRTAAADFDVQPIDGVRIGTVAVQVLEELNSTQTESDSSNG